MSEKHPHVSEADRLIVERFGDRLTNTGGNDPLDLLEDLANPRNTNLVAVNLPRFCLAMAVSAQVSLLRVLDLPEPRPKRLALINIRDLLEGDLVDLEETLEKYDGDYADKVAAEHEYATVESVEVVEVEGGVPTKYLLATNQVNLLLPWGEKIYALV